MQLICAFVSTNTKNRFSHDAAYGIPNSFYFGVLRRDHSGGKPKGMSKNPFLMGEGVVDSWVLILNTHVLGIGLLVQ